MSSEHEQRQAEFEAKAKAAEAQGDFCEAAYYRGQRNLAPGTDLDRDSFEDGWTACEAQTGRLTREIKAQLAEKTHSCISWPKMDELGERKKFLSCVWLSDGRKIVIKWDGSRCWLEVEQTPIIVPMVEKYPAAEKEAK